MRMLLAQHLTGDLTSLVIEKASLSETRLLAPHSSEAGEHGDPACSMVDLFSSRLAMCLEVKQVLRFFQLRFRLVQPAQVSVSLGQIAPGSDQAVRNVVGQFPFDNVKTSLNLIRRRVVAPSTK